MRDDWEGEVGVDEGEVRGVVEINKKSVTVGAISTTFFPAIIGGIALLWGSVGTEKPFS